MSLSLRDRVIFYQLRSPFIRIICCNQSCCLEQSLARRFLRFPQSQLSSSGGFKWGSGGRMYPCWHQIFFSKSPFPIQKAYSSLCAFAINDDRLLVTLAKKPCYCALSIVVLLLLLLLLFIVFRSRFSKFLDAPLLSSNASKLNCFTFISSRLGIVLLGFWQV